MAYVFFTIIFPFMPKIISIKRLNVMLICCACSSSEWTDLSEEERKELEIEIQEDGEFWYCLLSFDLLYFNIIINVIIAY